MCEWESRPRRTIPTAYYPNQGGRRRHGREFLAITALTTNNHGGRTLAPERYAAISVVPRVVSVPAHPNPRFRRDTAKCPTALGRRAQADFWLPPIQMARSRRRQITPPHSRSSLRLKQETARPSQFPQDDPSFPAGSGISNISLVSLSSRWESGVSTCPGLSTFTRIFLPFSSLSHVRANERQDQGLGLAAISEARASACVSIYSRMFVSLPFRTVMAKTQWSSNVLFVALILPVAKPTTRTRSPCAMNSGGSGYEVSTVSLAF